MSRLFSMYIEKETYGKEDNAVQWNSAREKRNTTSLIIINIRLRIKLLTHNSVHIMIKLASIYHMLS